MASASGQTASAAAAADRMVQDPVYRYLKQIGGVDLLTAEDEVELAIRIEAGLYAEEKLGQGDWPADLRRDLEQVAEEGRRAKATMLEANLRLVVSVAKRYADRPGYELLDVIQEGNLGLIRAVEKFDYKKGYKFSTYAMWWIRQAIQRGFGTWGRTVRLPAHVLEALSKLGKLQRQWRQDADGDEPSVEDLMVAWNATIKPGSKSGKGMASRLIDADGINLLLSLNSMPLSLDEAISEDGGLSVGDVVEDPEVIDIGDLVSMSEMSELLEAAVTTLTPREAKIIAMRFGLYDGQAHTLSEVGRAVGLTSERVRQLEKQALAKLRQPERSLPLLAYAS